MEIDRREILKSRLEDEELKLKAENAMYEEISKSIRERHTAIHIIKRELDAIEKLEKGWIYVVCHECGGSGRKKGVFGDLTCNSCDCQGKVLAQPVRENKVEETE